MAERLSMTGTSERICEECGRPYQRRRYGVRLEDRAVFEDRRFCGPQCAQHSRVLPARERHCGCGRTISKRATHCRYCRDYPRDAIDERFWVKVEKTPTCWLWRGATGSGYGRLRTGGKDEPMSGAHRIAWELTNGPIPAGLFVCHHCDTPGCVRPDHLFLGTAQENMQDASRKDRMLHGTKWHACHRGVPAEIAEHVKSRDGGCVLARLVPGHVCRDRWGNVHEPTRLDLCTFEHVKSEMGTGRRAPSDAHHLVIACYHSNAFTVETSKYRPLIREYLAKHEPRG